MERGGLSQVPEAERRAGALADADRDDTAQPLVRQLVRLPQARRLELADQAEPFCLEVKDLCGSLEGSPFRTCQTKSAAPRCVTSGFKLVRGSLARNDILSEMRSSMAAP